MHFVTGVLRAATMPIGAVDRGSDASRHPATTGSGRFGPFRPCSMGTFLLASLAIERPTGGKTLNGQSAFNGSLTPSDSFTIARWLPQSRTRESRDLPVIGPFSVA